MSVNFSLAVLATDSEQKVYQTLKQIPQEEFLEPWDIFWKETTIDFYDGKKSVMCISESADIPKLRQFVCAIFQNDPRGVGYKIKGNSPVTEVRYGDIDKDGDVDIAFKFMDGAIRVFHNSRVNK